MMTRDQIITELQNYRENWNHAGFEHYGELICDVNAGLIDAAVKTLKAQGEVIDDLLKVGYPHNFQREEPWIVNYMYAITDVIKKAVNLNNGR